MKAFFSSVKRCNNSVYYIDRISNKKEKEKIYGERFLRILYGKTGFPQSFIASFLRGIFCKSPWFSQFYGWLQKSRFSKRKILPFIQNYAIDVREFQDSVESFSSFNDFFIRKIHPDFRPVDLSPEKAVAFADGRYLVFNRIDQVKKVFVKGQKISLQHLIGSKKWAKKYEKGSIVFARLCPTDYHRFHFPFDSEVKEVKKIGGYLHSVSPIALRENLFYLWENTRILSVLKNPFFQEALFIEIGATNVGSIHQTYQTKKVHLKGEEKGFFSFGGSFIALVFLPNTIVFDRDLVENTQKGLETKVLFGQSLGRSIN